MHPPAKIVPGRVDLDDHRGERYRQMARLILVLEVPVRPCPLHPGQKFEDSCRHLHQFDHGLTLEQWAELLATYDPPGYADPPLADHPCPELPGEDRIAVMRQRLEDGKHLYHPLDGITVSSQPSSTSEDCMAEWGQDDLDANGQPYPLARLARLAVEKSHERKSRTEHGATVRGGTPRTGGPGEDHQEG